MKFTLASEADTGHLAAVVAQALDAPCVVALCGPLGAGKTTWVRALLRALGHEGVVPSPTYTLVEPYRTHAHTVYHVDLYRMQDEAEFEALGLREHFDGQALVLIEWPERCPELLARADLVLRLVAEGTGERRGGELEARSVCGEQLLARVLAQKSTVLAG